MTIRSILLSVFLICFESYAGTGAPQFWNRPTTKSQYRTDITVQLLEGLENLTTTYDESINFHPSLNLYQVAAQLTDLYGTQGSQLCAPIAITHGFTYLKYPAQYTQLKEIPDVDGDGTTDTYYDKIRYFFQQCQTDKEIGTRYRQAIGCMKNYILESGYNAYAYIIGPHTIEAPPGVPLETIQKTLNVHDIRSYVGHRLMVIMGIGWYTHDAATNTWTRQGGHFFNVYGYNYSNAWGENQIILNVVNNWVDYSEREPQQMYDTIHMTKLPDDGMNYPPETAYMLSGQGFDFTQKAFVEDIFVALPIQ